MRALDAMSPAKAAGMAVVLSAVNPKNLILTAGAAAAIAGAGISAGDQATAFAVYVVVASAGTGAPVVVYFALGERSKPLLDHLRSWMAANNVTIMAVLLLVIGAKLLGDGISGL
jgi:predicted component of type VI protein secretion system